jgi:O-antigen/teichoic acid export membrane protein
MISTEFVLHTITARAFSLLFGYFHGLAPLGNFQFAWRLCDEVAALVETSVNRFGLSFFAGKEHMSADMTSSFSTGSQIITAITTPIFSGIALVANDFVPWFSVPDGSSQSRFCRFWRFHRSLSFSGF